MLFPTKENGLSHCEPQGCLPEPPSLQVNGLSCPTAPHHRQQRMAPSCSSINTLPLHQRMVSPTTTCKWSILPHYSPPLPQGMVSSIYPIPSPREWSLPHSASPLYLPLKWSFPRPLILIPPSKARVPPPRMVSFQHSPHETPPPRTVPPILPPPFHPFKYGSSQPPPLDPCYNGLSYAPLSYPPPENGFSCPSTFYSPTNTPSVNGLSHASLLHTPP